jgi:alcohol dehydrogenase
MAHQLGGVYNLPHGLCNAILLPFVMEFNQQVAKSGFSEIAHKLWPFETEEMSIDEASSYLIQKVNELSEKIATKVSLKGLGVKEEDIPLLADKTLLDGNLPRNPIQPTKQEVEELFREAY